MDYVEGRGISNGNEVYFIFDAENDVVVMATYKNAPGVRSDLLQPNIIKTFSKDEWGDINEFLSAGRDDYDEDEDEDDDVIEIDSEGKVHPPEGEKVLAEIQELRKEGVTLPKMNNTKAILPENSVPAMTKDEVQERFDPITGTQNEEKGDEELADATMREEKENGKE